MKKSAARHQVGLFSAFLLSSVSFVPFAIAQNNNIVIDQSAHQGAGAPHFVQSANGTDVLNIVKPTAGGVSHNKFIEYNVSDKNLILNNLSFKSNVGQAESTLGGTVAYNPNFGLGDAARVILNEVTSNSTTALKGYTEIFGQKAALIIANPNGITAEGAGFINTSRLTMITGKPNVVDGKVQDFAISTVGTIKVEGVGEEAFGLHVQGGGADLVSQAVKIAGNIFVDADQELNVKTGNDTFDYESKKITSKPAADTGDASTPEVTVAIDSSALGGMYAGRIKIEATQSGMGIRTDGNLVADMDNVEITADGDIVFKNAAAKNNVRVASASGAVTHQDSGIVVAENNASVSAKNDVALNGDFVLSDSLEITTGKDINSNTQLAALSSANLKAENDINLNSQFLNAADIAIEAKNNLTNAGKLVADNNLTVTVGNNLTNNDTILAQNNGSLTVGNNTELNGTAVSAKTLEIKSATLTNNAQIATDDTLSIATSGDLTNNSKIAAGTDATLAADNIHNLGQIAAAGNINISAENDYINHRDSGLIAGADMVIEVGKDIVNYLSEIFAGGNIELKGKDAKIGDVDPNKVYDNPNVDNNHTAEGGGNNEFDIKPGEIDEGDDELEITLVDSGKKLILPPTAFAEEPNLGDSYTIDGYTIYIGERKVTPSETPGGKPTISFEDIDKMTILDASGNEVKYTLWDDSEEEGEKIDTTSGMDFKTSDKIDSQISSTPFEASQDQFNALVNLGGRIESLNNIDIKSDKLYNMGYNHNTGTEGYSTVYDKIRNEACYNCGWLELGRYRITETHMDSEAASILAGNDLNINTRDILNQSSTFSAKNNATVNTAQLVNQTYSEIAQIPILKQMRTKKKKRFRTRKKTYNATEYYYERFYSKEKSLVTAGNNLVINAVDGNVVNDQVEEPVGAFRFGRDEAPDLKSGQVPVDLTLPRGNNGMFAVGNNPKYMVTSTVDYFGKNFAGSDYFFDRITPFSDQYNTRKMLGDPAYETRLIMDAIRKATYGHYLGNGEISTDLEQMKALYNNAAKEYERLDLKIGIALTPEQIKQLNSDIIWYVEKEINGEMVLVPELYLCDATLDKIKIGGYGAKMTGQNIAIAAGNISNSGDMFARNEISLKAQNLRNESNRGHTARIIGNTTNIETSSLKNSGAKIDGNVTSIKADSIHNEAKLYTENAVWGITRQEKDGSISGNNLNIETGSLTNIAGEIKGGNISIKSDEITNTNRVFKDSKYYGNGYSHTETEGKQAKIAAEGHLDIEAGDITNRGSRIGGKTANIKADNVLNETNVLTSESEAHGKKWRNYNLSQNTGAEATIYGDDGIAVKVENDYVSKGAKLESKNGDISLEAGDVTIESVELHNRSESYRKKKGTFKKKTTTSISDSLKNVGSSIVAGGNAFVNSVKDLFARGAKVEAGEDAQIIVGGDANIVAAQDHSYSFTKKTKSSWGGLKKSKDIVEHEENRLKGSSVKSSEGLTIVSGKDTNIVASNVEAGKDVNILAGYKAGENGKVEKSGENGSVNILSGEETTKHREVHEKTDLSKGLKNIGLAVATGGYSIYADGIDYNRGKLGVSMDLGEKSKDTWDNIQKNTVSSNIIAGGDVNLSATDNVNIKGSNVLSDSNVNISAKNNINITSSQSTEDDKKTHSESKISATAGVGHVAADAAYAVDDGIKALEEVKKAKKELDELKQLRSQGKATDKAVHDAEINLALVIENAGINGMAAYDAVDAAQSATTAPTLGFYGEAGLKYDTTQTTSTSSSVENTASNIIAEKDIKLNAGNDLNQVGSLVISNKGNIDYNVGNDLNLQASKDTYKANSKTTSDSISAGVTNKGGVYGDFATSKSSSRAEGEHYNYSGTLATEGKISMNVGNDMIADGYNALAKDVDINVGGDMSLSSKQNTDYAKDTSHGFGVGAGSNSKNTHLSNNHSNSDRQWTDNMASIVGTESVDIDVDGKLKMDGSMIANIDKDGKDAGNLDIKAGSIETSDISNYNRNSESGFSIDRRTGASNTGENDGKGKGYLDIGIVNKGSVTEGETKATIGKGNIEVADGSDISGINRDIDNANTITRDQITGALDGKLMLTGSWADTVWSSPNSALGLAWGIAGMPFGAEMHYDAEKGAVYFTDNPLGLGNSGMTLGEVINYYNQYKPYMEHYSPYNRDIYINVREHENTHVDQARELGPLYLPVYGASWISILWGKPSFLENQADKMGEVK